MAEDSVKKKPKKITDMTIEELSKIEKDYNKKISDLDAKIKRLEQDKLKLKAELGDIKYIRLAKIAEEKLAEKDKIIKSLQPQQPRQ